MSENHSELRVVRRQRDGRRRFDADAKQALVEAALKSGVSVARLAQQNNVNANLLRKWITKYLLARGGDTAPPALQDGRDATKEESPCVVDEPAMEQQPAFVPVVSFSQPVASPVPLHTAPTSDAPIAVKLHVRLPNGVEFHLAQTAGEELESIVQMLGRMTCSSSTKA